MSAYNKIFSKESFLDPSPSYSGQLPSMGFEEKLFTGRRVLEIGAGKGRLTSAVRPIAAGCKSYIAVEPSDAILEITGVDTIRCSFEEIDRYVELGSIDYIIAHGVIPHINQPLSAIISGMARLLSDDGILHVVSSYYGYPKTLSRQMRHLPGVFLPSLITTLLQYVSPHSWFVKNCIYSFQNNLLGKYRQHAEFFAVSPYNIFWTYRDYSEAVSNAGLRVNRWFAHPISFIASKSGESVKIGVPFGKTAVLGSDWSSLYVGKLLKCPVAETDEGFDSVIIGHDWTIGEPYWKTVERCFPRVLGKDLFLFQMLL